MTFCANRDPNAFGVACSPCPCGKQVEAEQDAMWDRITADEPVPVAPEVAEAVVDTIMRSRFRKFRTSHEESA